MVRITKFKSNSGYDMIIRPVKATKEGKHETFCEELLKERAAVLSRAGFALEEAIANVCRLEKEIADQCRMLMSSGEKCADLENGGEKITIETINANVDKFNKARQEAELKYYYLIVTREALGLRRHNIISDLYPIPAKKKKIEWADGQV